MLHHLASARYCVAFIEEIEFKSSKVGYPAPGIPIQLEANQPLPTGIPSRGNPQRRNEADP